MNSITFDGTKESLMKLIRYEPETGAFYRIFSGKELGPENKSVYLTIRLNDGKTYYAHRLAWLYVYGEFPAGNLDHINGNKRDNRIVNLRQCNQSQNMVNTGRQSNNKTGYRGVRLRSDGKKYDAQIGLNGKRYHLGSFDTPEEAAEAYRAAALRMHHGFTRIT
jgi:hypothetical protein